MKLTKILETLVKYLESNQRVMQLNSVAPSLIHQESEIIKRTLERYV